MAGEAFIDGETGPEVAPPASAEAMSGRQGGEIVLPSDEHTRRQFLATLGLAGAGAGAATAYAYGPEGDTAGDLELAADDPEFPEQLSPIMTEGTIDHLQLAEDTADLIESRVIQLDAETSAALGVGGVAAVGGKQQEIRFDRRKLIAGLVGGTIALSAADFAQAANKKSKGSRKSGGERQSGGIRFVAHNPNDNSRSEGEHSGRRLIELELTQNRPISLDEFTRIESCQSPRGARLFAEHEAVQRHNAEVRRKIAAGDSNPGTGRRSPATMFSGWHQKPSNVRNSNARYSFFRLRDQVAVTGEDGQRRNVYKHYGVSQHLGARTRDPHFLMWSGYLGTDQRAAQRAMTAMLDKA